jgi:hypothetical protein
MQGEIEMLDAALGDGDAATTPELDKKEEE